LEFPAKNTPNEVLRYPSKNERWGHFDRYSPQVVLKLECGYIFKHHPSRLTRNVPAFPWNYNREVKMCGRFTLFVDAETLQEEFGLNEAPANYSARYNISPTQPLMVLADATARQAEWMRWGLIPSWAKDPTIGSRMINARSETLQEKPAFRNAFAKRRCLIFANGFYEWKRDPSGKTASIPYYFHLTNEKPFAFAGLWEAWHSPEGEDVRSCTIITCGPNGLVAPIHDRMPVILTGNNLGAWLGPGSVDAHQALLRPFPEKEMTAYVVSRGVNVAGRESPELIHPVG
jgi:putative SOS response-associated peptidase YedK